MSDAQACVSAISSSVAPSFCALASKAAISGAFFSFTATDSASRYASLRVSITAERGGYVELQVAKITAVYFCQAVQAMAAVGNIKAQVLQHADHRFICIGRFHMVFLIKDRKGMRGKCFYTPLPLRSGKYYLM